VDVAALPVVWSLRYGEEVSSQLIPSPPLLPPEEDDDNGAPGSPLSPCSLQRADVEEACDDDLRGSNGAITKALLVSINDELFV
jgi:hypothetical protein